MSSIEDAVSPLRASPYPNSGGNTPTLSSVVPERKRMDSIQLLRNFHGSNTVLDDCDSPLPMDSLDSVDPYSLSAEEALSHPAIRYFNSFDEDDDAEDGGNHSNDSSPRSSNTGTPRSTPGSTPDIPVRRLNREDSMSLLKRLNNWNTAGPEFAQGGQPDAPSLDSPRWSKISELNKKYNKDDGAKSGAGMHHSRVIFPTNIEETTYFASLSPNLDREGSSPGLLTRRDSITLQQSLHGNNTVFGMHADSPRWKKVALLNKQRAARKEKAEREERASKGMAEAATPSRVQLDVDNSGGRLKESVFFSNSTKEDAKDDDGLFSELDEDVEAAELVTAMARFGGNRHGAASPHDELGAAAQRIKAARMRDRSDSVRLMKESEGHNTIPGTVGARKKKVAGKLGGLSPRQTRVKQLNEDRNAKKVASRDDASGEVSEKIKSSKPVRKQRATAPMIYFGSSEMVKTAFD
jgi:hypothetical protein